MSRALAHRLTKLERQARTRGLPMWPELDAVMERRRTAAHAYVDMPCCMARTRQSAIKHKPTLIARCRCMSACLP